jgi:hypothetical protein
MITRIMPGRSLVIRKKVFVEKTLILCRVGIDACTRERGCGAVGIRGWSESGPGTLEQRQNLVSTQGCNAAFASALEISTSFLANNKFTVLGTTSLETCLSISCKATRYFRQTQCISVLNPYNPS